MMAGVWPSNDTTPFNLSVSGECFWPQLNSSVLPLVEASAQCDAFGNSTAEILLRDSDPDRKYWHRLLWNLNLYVTPVIIAVGTLGNVTSFLVFACTHVRCLSSSIYLAALALADTGFLLQLFVVWLNYVKVFVFHQNGWCQTFVYLTYVCSFLSVWYVVSFTVERYIAVCYPLRRQNMCTVPRAKKVVFCLGLFSALAYTFGAWTSGVVDLPNSPNRTICSPLDEYIPLLTILNNVDTVVTLIVPSLLIFVMNVRIVCKISYFYKMRMTMTSSLRHPKSRDDAGSDDSGPEGGNKSASLRDRSQIKITKMLLVVSTIFLLLNLPSHAIRVHAFVMTFIDSSYSPSGTLLLWQQVFTIIYNCNFAVNFFLYSLCGKNFRKALCRLLQRCRYRTGGILHRKYSSFRIRSRREAAGGEPSSIHTLRSLTSQTVLASKI